jgi:hypothetical protein
MTRRRFARWLLVLGVLAIGSAVPAGTADAESGQPRPMTGTCSTTFTAETPFVFDIVGTCQLTHLGRAEYHATQTISPNSDGSFAIAVTGYYVAADGDRLDSSIVGTASSSGGPSVAYTTTETFDGGTGRFADATGTVVDVGVATFTSATTGTSAYTTSGSISY